jgi:hypothetical protein
MQCKRVKRAVCLLLALTGAASSLSVSAHHSFAAQYDINQPITLSGKVTKVEWTNPHARFYVDVTDESGNVHNWNIELGSPNFLRRAGWSRNDLQVGDDVTVSGSMARSGADMANAESVILGNGKQVFGRNSADNN